MKKYAGYFIFAALFWELFSGIPASAHHQEHRNPPPPPPVVPVSTSAVEYEEPFTDCSEHYLFVTKITTTYSDNSASTVSSYSVLNADGSAIISNCKNVEHLTTNSGHYFLVDNKKVINSYGEPASKENYLSANIISYDRIKVSKSLSFWKTGYGIIDYSGNEIIPPKYQSIKSGNLNNGLYISKLNGYYGIIDLNNNILIKNEYDSIKELHYTYLLKKNGLYGLAGANGQIIYNPVCEKVKKLGEYIIVLKNNKWGVLDSYGNILSSPVYKKIVLDRNTLTGITSGGNRIIIKSQ